MKELTLTECADLLGFSMCPEKISETADGREFFVEWINGEVAKRGRDDVRAHADRMRDMWDSMGPP